jgi:hypothetical protein
MSSRGNFHDIFMDRDFFLLTLHSSIHLTIIDPKTREPRGVGTGVLVEYKGNRFLLSVAHNAIHKDPVAVTVDTDLPAAGGTVQYVLEDIHWPVSIPPDGLERILNGDVAVSYFTWDPKARREGANVIDFMVAPVPDDLVPLQSEIELWEVGSSQKRTVRTALDQEPSKDGEYAFYGCTRPNIRGVDKAGLPLFERTPVFVGGVRYQRTSGDYHEFLLPRAIVKAEELQGTSGAPIINERGELVALIVCGSEGRAEVWGVSVAAMKGFVDAWLLAQGK